jgi:hypothetical protein
MMAVSDRVDVLDDAYRDIWINHVFYRVLCNTSASLQAMHDARTQLALVCKAFAEYIREMPSTNTLHTHMGSCGMTPLEQEFNVLIKQGTYSKGGASVRLINHNIDFLDRNVLNGRQWQINGNISVLIEQPSGLWIIWDNEKKSVGTFVTPVRLFPDQLEQHPGYRRMDTDISPSPVVTVFDESLQCTPEELGFTFVSDADNNRSLATPIVKYMFRTVLSYNGRYMEPNTGRWCHNKRVGGIYGIIKTTETHSLYDL